MQIEANLKVLPSSTNVEVSIRNLGAEICAFHTPFDIDNSLNYEFFRLKNAFGEKIKYIGATVLSRSEVIELTPLNTISFSLDLAKEYLITAPIQHYIEYSVNCINKGIAFSNIANISARTILLENSASKQLILSPEERNEGYSPNIEGIIKDGYKFIGTNNQSLIDDTLIAVSHLKMGLEKISELKINNKLQDYYYKYICNIADSSIYYDYISRVYSKTLSYISADLEFSFSGSKCKSNIFAYVYASSPIKIIYLCNFYNNSPLLPGYERVFDTKLGTIVHELTHKVSKGEIVDYTYGIDSCLRNIKEKSCRDTEKCFVLEDGIFSEGGACAGSSKPNTNVYTADCLEFLVEAAYFDHFVNITAGVNSDDMTCINQ